MGRQGIANIGCIANFSELENDVSKGPNFAHSRFIYWTHLIMKENACEKLVFYC